MSKETKRPSVDKELYDIAEMYCVGKSMSPNQCFEEAFELIFEEGGERIDGVGRLYTFCEENDVDPNKVLERILTKVIDADGEMNIQFKERIKADEVDEGDG